MSFEGFHPPEANYSKLPHQFIWHLPDFSCHAELCVVIYTLRHTWGFNEYGQLKRISLDEYENGRKRADGTRIDRGCGVKAAAVRRGLARAVEHGFLIHDQDARDPGRVENYYGLNINHVIQGDQLDHPMNHNDPPSPDRNDHPDRSNRSPERRKTLQKDTYEKDTTRKYVGDAEGAQSNPPPPTQNLRMSTSQRMKAVKARHAVTRSKPPAHVESAFTPPPVPPPPSPPPAAAEQGSPAVPEARDPYIVTGGDIPPNQHDQTPVPFSHRRFLESLTAEQAQAQLKQHPLWVAYAAAFPDGAKPDIDRWEVESIEVALKTLDDLRVTPEEVTTVMAAWLPQRKKTQKPHRFIYLPGDVRNWRQMHPVSTNTSASRAETDALAADELATVEGCQRVIADLDRPPFMRKAAQEQLLRLTQPPVPDDYWPDPEPGESDESYTARRDDLWAAVWQSGFGDQYLPGERPLLRAEAVP